MCKFSAILIFIVLFNGGCFFSSSGENANSGANRPAANQTVAAEQTGANANARSAEKKAETPKTESKPDCLNIKVAGKKTDEKQTFAFDHEPFRNACFVTLHDPQFDDPPLDSEFFIYRDGKEAFRFPNQFNGVTTGCWIEAVAFQDLNEDDLADVVVAGLCSAKSAPYSENMVYVNKGDSFSTNEEANYTLEKFKKIKDIADFVKQNKDQFFQ